MTQSNLDPWVGALHPSVSDGSVVQPPRGTLLVQGPGAPTVSDDAPNKRTILTFPDSTVVTKTVASTSSAFAAGQVAMPKNGKLTLATTAALSGALYHGGIVLAAATANQDVAVVTQGFVDPAVVTLGAGLACAVGTDASGNPVRVIDPTCVSGLKFLGVCDANGAIYVSPRQASLVNVLDFGAVGDGTGGGGADQTAFDAAIAFLYSSNVGGVGFIGGHTIYAPAGHYKLSAEITIPVNMPIIIQGEGQATTLIEWTTICNGFALHSPFGETRIANIVVRDVQLYNSATVSLYCGQGGTYWKPNTAYALNDVVAFPGNSNRLLKCTSGGTSNANGTPFGTLWAGDPRLPFLYITGTPAAQYPFLIVQIYDTGTIGGGLTVKYATDGISLSSPITPSGPTVALGATGLTLHLQDLDYESPGFYVAPPDGAGFGNIVGDVITDGGVTWEVIDGGVGLLFENGAQIKIERSTLVGWVLCIANDGCDNFFVDASCNLGNNHGVWTVSANERQNGFPTMHTATTGSGSLSATPSTVNVGSTMGAPSTGAFWIIANDGTFIEVTYTGTSSTTFTGCTATASSYDAKAYVSIPVPLQQASATNIMKVEDTEIFNFGIGVADSGGFNHKYSMINFESRVFGPSRPTYIWATGVQGGVIEGITGEGAYRVAAFSSVSPFTGTIEENGTWLRCERFEGECNGDSAIVLKMGPGTSYASISFNHSDINMVTAGVPVVIGIEWVLGFRTSDSTFTGGTGPFDFTQTAVATGLFLYEQTSSGTTPAPGFGINCIAQSSFDCSGSFGLHTRTITGAYTVDAGVYPDYSPDHTLLMSGGPYDVTLPPTQHARRKLVFKAIDNSAISYRIKQNGSETIDGATTYTITLQNGSVELTCDESGNYWVTGSYNGTVI